MKSKNIPLVCPKCASSLFLEDNHYDGGDRMFIVFCVGCEFSTGEWFSAETVLQKLLSEFDVPYVVLSDRRDE